MARTPRSKPTPNRPIETLMTPTQAAGFLGVHRNTLRAWRSAGTGPSFTQHSERTIRYRISDLLNHQAEGAAV